jgi:branched-chain amino acid aminotransferase
MNDNLAHPDFLVFQNQLYKTSDFDRSNLLNADVYYEVIRVIDGRFVFLQNHLKRLTMSLQIAGVNLSVDELSILSQMRLCIRSNSMLNGNIRFALCHLNNTLFHLCEIIPHAYPSSDDYKYGVDVSLIGFVRNNPNVKIWHQQMKDVIRRYKSRYKVYETILYSPNGNITEGSQSNCFFIRDKVVYTTPDDLVLKGITRDYVLKIVGDLGLSLKLESINKSELPNFDAMFLTGTSPKVLPVKSVLACVNFDVNNRVLLSIMNKYNELLNKSLFQ